MSEFVKLHETIEQRGYATPEECQRLHELEQAEAKTVIDSACDGRIADLVSGNDAYGVKIEEVANAVYNELKGTSVPLAVARLIALLVDKEILKPEDVFLLKGDSRL